MQAGTRIGIGVGIGAATVVGAGVLAAVRSARANELDHVDATAPRHAVPDTSPGDEPPGGLPRTSPGDEPVAELRVRGHVDPPGWFDDYGIDGALVGERLDATMDPRGWGNDVRLTGRVDHHRFQTKVDPAGWLNETSVTGVRRAGGYHGTVDRPGLWNDVDHVISEGRRGAGLVREGRFDEPLVPGFSEAVWRSFPNGRHGVAGRTLEFDPPGWANTTRVTLEAELPAGVEATIAAALFHEWKVEQERAEDYPDPGYPHDRYPGDTGPGDDGGLPTSPGDGDGGRYDPYPTPDEVRMPQLPPFS